MLLIWLSVLHNSFGKGCTKTTYFTECSSLNTREAIITSSADCALTSAEVVKDLDCSFECPAGYFRSVSSLSQTCEPCPAGTFNHGGGVLYGGDGMPWDLALPKMISECWIREDYLSYRNHNCTAWEQYGQVLTSGTTDLKHVAFSSGLIINTYLIRPGNLIFSFRKDTFRYNGKRIGSFAVYCDSEQIFFDNDLNDNKWKTEKLNLEPGNHELYFEYTTIVTNSNPDPTSSIASISINGTDYASDSCYLCRYGAKGIGSTECDKCDFNQYSESGTCVECPSNLFSYPGSVGIESCKPRLNCSEYDYKIVYSKCIDNLRTKFYKFIDPVLCDVQNFVAPDNKTLVECEPCEMGYYLVTSNDLSQECVPCPVGMIFQVRNDTAKCIQCASGQVPLGFINYTNWDDIPTTFESYCLLNDGSKCLTSNGWIPKGEYLTSGKYLSEFNELYLEKEVYISTNSGEVLFSAEFLNYESGVLNFFIDSQKISFSSPLNSSFSAPLGLGYHRLQWIYIPYSNSHEELRIFYITILGSDEGASLKCAACPEGYISQAGSSKCSACPPGFTSNFINTECLKCGFSTVSYGSGSKCFKCPVGTNSNFNNTKCLGLNYVYFKNYAYFLGNITGRGSVEGEYFAGVCNMPTSSAYCHQTFYGPLQENGTEFYVSIANPSQLLIPNAKFLYSPVSAYAFAVHYSQDLSNNKQNIKNSCKYNKIIINLGTALTGMQKIDSGFQISYSEGDNCEGSEKKYTSNVKLICDKDANVGWPTLASSESCSYEFVWKSRYGCEVCNFNELKTIVSECVGGVRTYLKIEGENCILPVSGALKWNEKCEEYEDYIDAWPFIFISCLIVGLIIIGLTSGVCYYKYYRGYRRLVEVKD